MVVGSSTESELHKWYNSLKLKDARESLKNYPVLQKISNNFTNLDSLNDNYNAFINILSHVKNKKDERWLSILQRIDETMKALKIDELPRKKLDKFRERLVSASHTTSNSLLMELTILAGMVMKFGIKNIAYEPKLSNGSQADISLRNNGQTYFIEICSLADGKTERNLQSIFEKVSNWLLHNIADNRWIKIVINTRKLRYNSDGSIDVAGSVEKTINYIEKLKLIPMCNVNSDINFDEFSNWSDSGSLYDKKDIVKWYDSELFNSIEKEPFKSFSQSFHPKDKDCPILDFFSTTSTHGTHIELHSHNIFPSEAATLQMSAFCRRVLRKMEFKRQKEQFEPRHPNIIVMQAFDWTKWGYTKKDDPFADEDFEPIKVSIKEFFSRSTLPYLSAVYLFETDIKNNRIVLNEFCNQESLVTEHEINDIFQGLNC